jgi:hypothetical protein
MTRKREDWIGYFVSFILNKYLAIHTKLPMLDVVIRKRATAMKSEISYEWAIECQDSFGDIQSVNFSDSYSDAKRIQAEEQADWHKVEIAVVRTEGNQLEGIKERYYSYVLETGLLEPQFSSYHTEDGGANDGPNVPQRFHKEVLKG